MLMIDYETYSEAKFGKAADAVTAAAYAEHPSTEALCMAWKRNRGPVKLWVPGLKLHSDIREAVEQGEEIHAWNVGFEYEIWTRAWVRQIPDLPIPREEQWRDTMAAAAYYGLPQKLEDFGKYMGLTEQKDMVGHKLMQKHAKPRTPTKNNPATRWLPELMPTEKLREKVEAERQQIYSYCIQDVVVEYAAHEMLKGAPCLS